MATIPNLYLKWRLFRELIGVPQSDAQIGSVIFGEGRDGAQKFSKLLYGDYGCSPEIAEVLADFINRRLDLSRKSRGLAPLGADALLPADLSGNVYDFARKITEAGAVTDATALDRAQDALLEEITPAPSSTSMPRLVVEQYEMGRFFEPFVSSDDAGPLVFVPGKHKGRLAVQGIDRQPAMAYTFLVRDPRPAGQRSWDLTWGETLRWMPAPSQPRLEDGTLPLMADAFPVLPVKGRFLATSILVWDPAVQPLLDPRGANPARAGLTEEETSRFLTNLRRLQKRRPDGLTAWGAEYSVEVP